MYLRRVLVYNSIFGVLAASITAAAQPENLARTPLFGRRDKRMQVVFKRGDNGHKMMRIPALVRTKADSLLAFCEGRGSSADHGDVDLVLRRSTDGGETWDKIIPVYEEGGKKEITIGNPCAVVDQETGSIFLSFCRNNKDVFITRSDDDGLTWPKPIDITNSVKEQNWGWFATGPGHGIQVTRGKYKGRLLIPCDCEDKTQKGGIKESGHSFVIYSDDHGKTWQHGGISDKGMNECEVVECTDGSLLLSMRNYLGKDRRAFARSADGGETWSKAELKDQLYCCTCQASILRYSFEPSIMLYSGPAGPGRQNMTLYVSYDDGKTWPVSKLIYGRQTSYSELVKLPDGQIGLLMENDDHTVISFMRFHLNECDNTKK